MEDTNNKLPKLFITIILFFLGIFIWQWLSSPLVVSFIGTAEITVPATSADFQVAVSSIDSDPGMATFKAKSQVDIIKDVLGKYDISSESISVSQTRLTPASAIVAGASGYQAVNTIDVETQNPSQLDDIIVSLYKNGATMVSQPTVKIEKPDEADSEALDLAIKNAKEKASYFSKKRFKLMKKVVSISQTTPQKASENTTQVDIVSNGEVASVYNAFKINKFVNVTYKMW